jgi:aminoglycoside N3'-acetyltransferase
MTLVSRSELRSESNNTADTNKNLCSLRCAQALGVDSNVRYLHTVADLKRAISTKFSLRSVITKAKSKTVGGARKNLAGDQSVIAYLVWVDGHVMLLGKCGNTAIDTDPRENDRRKMHGVWAVRHK